MAIKIETNKRGEVLIWGENSAGQKHIITWDKIFFRASDGHAFIAPSRQLPLSRLMPHEVPMVEGLLREMDGPHEPDIFAGDPPLDG